MARCFNFCGERILHSRRFSIDCFAFNPQHYRYPDYREREDVCCTFSERVMLYRATIYKARARIQSPGENLQSRQSLKDGFLNLRFCGSQSHAFALQRCVLLLACCFAVAHRQFPGS